MMQCLDALRSCAHFKSEEAKIVFFSSIISNEARSSLWYSRSSERRERDPREPRAYIQDSWVTFALAATVARSMLGRARISRDTRDQSRSARLKNCLRRGSSARSSHAVPASHLAAVFPPVLFRTCHLRLLHTQPSPQLPKSFSFRQDKCSFFYRGTTSRIRSKFDQLIGIEHKKILRSSVFLFCLVQTFEFILSCKIWFDYFEKFIGSSGIVFRAHVAK